MQMNHAALALGLQRGSQHQRALLRVPLNVAAHHCCQPLSLGRLLRRGQRQATLNANVAVAVLGHTGELQLQQVRSAQVLKRGVRHRRPQRMELEVADVRVVHIAEGVRGGQHPPLWRKRVAVQLRKALEPGAASRPWQRRRWRSKD